MWLSHAEIRGLVDGYWRSKDGSIAEKTESLADYLQLWNREIFGNLFERKKNLKLRIWS